jgi:two-component system phosphate regulon sensor histidine kinase PhoR
MAAVELSPGGPVQAAADRLAALTARGANAASSMIHLADGENMRLIGGWQLPQGFQRMDRVPVGVTMAGLVLHYRFPVVICDLSADPRVPPDAPSLLVGLRAYAGFPVRDPSGEVVGVCAVMSYETRDWTPEELAAADDGAQACTAFVALQRSRDAERRQTHFLDALLNSLDSGVAASDPDGRLVVVNRALTARLGHDFRGATVEQFAAEAHLDAGPLRRALRGRQVRGAEQPVTTRDAGERLYRVNAHPIADDRGQRLGAVSVFHDITGVRQAEELQHALSRAKDEYLNLIGHELRTPLTVIGSYLDLLADGDPDAPLAESLPMVAAARRGSDRLRRLVEALLDLSALDSGRAVLHHADLDMARLTGDAVRAIAARAADRQVELIARLPDLLPAHGDPDRLRQLVDALLDNAVTYTPQGGVVTLTLTVTGSTLRLEVADTGFGIPEHERPYVFDRFFRGAVATELAIPGAGLGLATARLIAERHEGELTLVPDVGRVGTTLRLTMPR